MPQPTIGQVHVDRPLTMISIAYIQDKNNFIADKVFPEIAVDKKSDLYYTYDKGDWFRDEAAPRGTSQETVGSGYNLATGNYNATTYGFHKDIDDEVRANSDAPLKPDQEATEFVTQRLLLRKERLWVSKYFTTGVWGTNYTPTNLWSDYAASNPIDDIENAKQTILENTGFEANTLTLSYQAFRILKSHPDLVDRIKYTGGILDQVATLKNLADLFELKRVLVAKAVYNSAAEGAAVAMGFTHGKHALLTHTADSPGLLTPSAGYTFGWKGISGGMGATVGVKRYRIEEIASDRVEGFLSLDQRVIASDLGYFFNGCVA